MGIDQLRATQIQNLRSSILKARVSSLAPPFSARATFDVLGLLCALPFAPASEFEEVVGCKSADRLALLPFVLWTSR